MSTYHADRDMYENIRLIVTSVQENRTDTEFKVHYSLFDLQKSSPTTTGEWWHHCQWHVAREDTGVARSRNSDKLLIQPVLEERSVDENRWNRNGEYYVQPKAPLLLFLFSCP